MPRRRTRNENKGRLLFTESPVNIPHGHLSPVLGATNPPTADVVPIDESFEVNWVSPQFRRVRSMSVGKPHRTTRQTSKPNKTVSGPNYARSHVPNNLVKLDFKNRSKKKKSIGLSLSSEDSFLFRLDHEGNAQDLAQKPRQLTRSLSEGSQQVQDHVHCFRRTSLETNLSMNRSPDFFSEEDNMPQNHLAPQINKGVSKVTRKLVSDSSESQDESQEDSYQTQKILDKPLNKAPIKRLFARLDSNDSDSQLDPVSPSNNTPKTKQKTRKKNFSFPMLELTPSQEVNSPKPKGKVLAEDTPEAFYGLGYLQRRKRSLSKKS